ncbi:hypothetical protein ACLX1H_000188 [Fusarium chlamydosporum]
MSNLETYTIGWICAILTEYVAAQELLDEEHDPPNFLQPNDSNHYTLGRIGGHNVAVAVLPDGEYGTDSAASVATSMLRTFPNIRIGLFVGIGGGAPSEKHDIRLGDIVVSAPRGGESGVFQYDFGKTIQDQVFQNTRSLDQPPRTLRTALVGIRARYQRRGHQLEQTIETILKRNPRLEDKYQRPRPDTDRLFKADFVHDERGCKEFCAVNENHLIRRRERTKHEDNPAVHYGLIASANRLMKDAVIWDKLGICDYSDSYKNKEW